MYMYYTSHIYMYFRLNKHLPIIVGAEKKNDWATSVCKRHYYGTKLASSKILFCSFLILVKNLFCDISIVIVATIYNISSTNELHSPVTKNPNTEMIRTGTFDMKHFLNAIT